MGSTSNTPQLPVIYLSDQTLKPGSSKWVEVRSDVRKAIDEYGAFEVSYDKVSEELKKSVLEAMKELFELPSEAKQRNVSPKPYVGYLTHNGLSESFGFRDSQVLEKVNEFTQLLRPDSERNKIISETIQTYSEKLSELDVMVRRMILESFGIEKYHDEYLSATNYRMRMTKSNGARVDANAGDCASVKSNAEVGTDVNYASADAGVGAVTVGSNADDNANTGTDVGVGDSVKANGGDDDVEKVLGLPAHTDKGLITVLYQFEFEGLELLTKDGKWIRPKPSHNTFLVLVGDTLYALLNGRLFRSFHRIRVTEKKKTRYSIGLFSTPNEDFIIEPAKELVDEKHPRLLKPFTYGDLMGSFYQIDIRRRSRYTLHDHFAVSGA